MAPQRVRPTWRPTPPIAGAGAFDRWAASYDRSQLQDVLYRPVHAAVLRRSRHLAPRARWVLGLRCGTGRLLRQAAAVLPGSVLVGLDLSYPMAAHARDAVPTLRPPAQPAPVVVGPAERLPFRNGVFDLVVSTLSARHWNDQHAAVTEIRRVLAPGGVLLLADARNSASSLSPSAPTDVGLRVRDVAPLPTASLFADVELIVASA